MATVAVFNVTPQSLQLAVNNGMNVQLSPGGQQSPSQGPSVPIGNSPQPGQFGFGQNFVNVTSMEGQRTAMVSVPSDGPPNDMMLFVAMGGWWIVDQNGNVAGSGSMEQMGG